MSEKRIRLLIYFSALSAGALLISNLSAIKLWNLGGIAVDGGIVLFPLTYILSDLTVELFGKSLSRTVIYAGFLINLIAVFVFYAVIALPAYPGWNMQEAYAAVLGFSPRIIFGSLAGYLSSNLLNNWLFIRMKNSDSAFSHSFIARALGSSALAHIVDSGVFETVAFLGVLPFREFAYILGMGLELLLSPLEAAIEKKLSRSL
ncbi:queuosine precursor transporter [Faecalibaculum rodentium]|uniref:queuosine precursor transporter n=1 Tax=Faecalibaculum rodentium TaxID=1702221 RepID=UPI0027152508|nr:queuosine precursor transporter [Faecalibaculum rodentium]